MQNGVLKSISFLFEYIGEMGKDYIYAIVPLLEDAWAKGAARGEELNGYAKRAAAAKRGIAAFALETAFAGDEENAPPPPAAAAAAAARKTPGRARAASAAAGLSARRSRTGLGNVWVS